MLIVIIGASTTLGFLLGMLLMALLAGSKSEVQGACVQPASALGNTLVLDRRLPKVCTSRRVPFRAEQASIRHRLIIRSGRSDGKG